MDVSEAVRERRSVRGFLDTPVDVVVLKELALKSARAATGGNIQPWHVDIVTGAKMDELKAIMRGKLERREKEEPGYQIYPLEMSDTIKGRIFGVGEELYGHLGIPREDKRARAAWFARNFQFFGAPAAYFVTVDRRMGPPQWSDLGMYLQNLMLLAVEAGLATCPQECWAVYPNTIEAFLGTPPERMLFCGVAIGVEDREDLANRTRAKRAPEQEWLSVL
ncbi:nitroreductase [Sphingomonas sp. SUN019]|uniref:nitroreductase n=1 Tax=Sphingomonas sp. SUN019 TaxID=2937788 RepID=UPI0021643968|nr:nitroreductase [Sphingomonas sp. SUN019]UVO50418.1 nitroreductase [Sphingomonas sp. SUN019]